MTTTISNYRKGNRTMSEIRITGLDYQGGSWGWCWTMTTVAGTRGQFLRTDKAGRGLWYDDRRGGISQIEGTTQYALPIPESGCTVAEARAMRNRVRSIIRRRTMKAQGL